MTVAPRRPAEATSTPVRSASLAQPLPAADVTLDRLAVRYGGVAAVNAISLDVKAGEFLAVLGPSGSGKTTVLMSIAGFTRPTSGDIRMAGRSIVDLPPERRGIGVVFQGYALFPHLTVTGNVAFPLEMAGVPREDIGRRVGRALATVGLSGFDRRLPRELSGGQQQRVALARALVFEPPLLLLDEPLGALDKQLRGTMQHEFRLLHREVGTTIVYVTHDQHEAMAMADRIAVMHEGDLVQVGSPREIFGRPSNRFVAGFVGDCNFLPVARIERSGAAACRVWVQDYAGEVACERMPDVPGATLAIRPHHVGFQEAGNGLPADVLDVIHLGELTEHLLRLRGGSTLRVRGMAGGPGESVRTGDHVCVGWDWSRTSLF